MPITGPHWLVHGKDIGPLRCPFQAAKASPVRGALVMQRQVLISAPDSIGEQGVDVVLTCARWGWRRLGCRLRPVCGPVA